MDRILVPKAAPAFSALGLLVSDYKVDLTRTYVTPVLAGRPRPPRRGCSDELDDEVTDELAPTGLGHEAVARARYVQMAYAGQNFDMSVPAHPRTGPDAPTTLLDAGRAVPRPARGRPRLRLPGPGADRARGAHHRGRPRRRSRRAWPSSVTVADAAAGADRRAARVLRRRVRRHPGVRRSLLGPGAELAGPALVEEPFTVVVVPPGAHAPPRRAHQLRALRSPA